MFAAERVVGALLHDLLRPLRMSGMSVDALTVLLGNGAIFVALLHYKKMSYADLFHSSPNSVAATVGLLAMPIFLIVPGLVALVISLEAVLQWFVPMSGWNRQTFGEMSSMSIAAIVATCLLAPFLEEMLFRGIILRAFLHQYGRWPAIVGSAALFGFAHLNIYQFLVGLILGSLSGWLYERARSLWPCILLHGSYNSLLTLMSVWSGGDEETWDLPLFLWAICMVFAGMGATMLWRLLGQRPQVA